MIDTVSLEALLSKYGVDLDREAQDSDTFKIMATRIAQKAGDLTLEEFFNQRFGWEFYNHVTWENFQTKMKTHLDLTKEEVKDVFDSMDPDGNGEVVVNDMVFTLKSYVKVAKQSGLETLSFQIEDIIPGYDDMSP